MKSSKRFIESSQWKQESFKDHEEEGIRMEYETYTVNHTITMRGVDTVVLVTFHFEESESNHDWVLTSMEDASN